MVRVARYSIYRCLDGADCEFHPGRPWVLFDHNADPMGDAVEWFFSTWHQALRAARRRLRQEKWLSPETGDE